MSDSQLTRELIQIANDFSDEKEVSFLVSERRYGGDNLHYESWRKRVVYHDSTEAEKAYLEFQRQAMLKHKWIESQKAGHDIGEMAAAKDWLNKHAEIFKRFWRRTHVFVPVMQKAEDLCTACCDSEGFTHSDYY